jgi:chorismate synthase
MEDLTIEGRHDTCIALRVPVVVEAAAAIVIADLMLQAQEIKRIF